MPRKPGHGGELPELELECMKVLWQEADLTVGVVQQRLEPRRRLAYTTVLTVLDRLARKGAVARRKKGRAHIYQAVVTQSACRERALARLLNNFFDGSRQSLASHLAGDADSAPALPAPALPGPSNHPDAGGPRPARAAVPPAGESGSLETALL